MTTLVLTLCAVLAYSESLPAMNALQERKGCVDFILIEVDMPIVNGYEFLSFLNKEQINVPLISKLLLVIYI